MYRDKDVSRMTPEAAYDTGYKACRDHMDEVADSISTFSNWRKQSGWRRSLSSHLWNYMCLNKPPLMGWETDPEGHAWFVMIEHTRRGDDEEIESRELCVSFDNIAQGLFYQRDWTSSGLPLCREGEPYWSGWWFQFKEDAEKFHELHGGIASWEEDYKQREAEMCEKRNGGWDVAKMR